METMIKICLAPVLLWQGRQVRKHTPRLAEAAGPRRGVQGKGSNRLRLLVIGDSAAAGVGVDVQENSLMGQLLGCFGPEFEIFWELRARSGRTTADMIEHLETGSKKNFDLAVTSLGVNDVKAGVRPVAWVSMQKQLIRLLKKKYGVRQMVVSAVPPMEKFPALPWPLGWYLGRQARQMNHLLSQWLSSRNDIHFLEFDLPLDPELMAQDGFHPGPKLHRIWARQAADLLLLSAV